MPPSGTTVTTTAGAPGRAAPRPSAVVDGGAPAVRPRPVLDLIAAHAEAMPDRTAVVDASRPGVRLTHGELADAVARKAERLREQGAGPGRLVAVRRPRGIEAVTAILATLHTGAAYLPLDVNAPAARTAAILADVCAAGADGLPDPCDTLPGELAEPVVARPGETVLPGRPVPPVPPTSCTPRARPGRRTGCRWAAPPSTTSPRSRRGPTASVPTTGSCSSPRCTSTPASRRSS